MPSLFQLRGLLLNFTAWMLRNGLQFPTCRCARAFRPCVSSIVLNLHSCFSLLGVYLWIYWPMIKLFFLSLGLGVWTHLNLLLCGRLSDIAVCRTNLFTMPKGGVQIVQVPTIPYLISPVLDSLSLLEKLHSTQLHCRFHSRLHMFYSTLSNWNYFTAAVQIKQFQHGLELTYIGANCLGLFVFSLSLFILFLNIINCIRVFKYHPTWCWLTYSVHGPSVEFHFAFNITFDFSWRDPRFWFQSPICLLKNLKV